MEVRIRDVDPVIVSKIDEMAKKLKQSRQVYLKAQIELIAIDYIQSTKIDHLEKQLQANTIYLKRNAEVMNEMNKSVNRRLNREDDIDVTKNTSPYFFESVYQ